MIKRNITPAVIDALKDTSVVLINGARQTGKSTLAQMLPEDKARSYITLDDPGQISAARSDPAGFISGLSGPVVIDEVQYALELLPCIKMAVDKDKQPGRFLLTGSADILFLPHLSESLAGRMEVVTLQTCSQGELMGLKDDLISTLFDGDIGSGQGATAKFSDYVHKVILGGYPGLINRHSQERRDKWFNSYIASILHKDVQQLFNIEGLTEFPKLLQLLSSRVGTILNVAELSRTSTIPNTTLHRYMAVLQTMFIARLIPAWSSNTGKRLVKAPKLFFCDTGLGCHLMGYDAQRFISDRSTAGRLLENFVVSELCKQRTWSSVHCQIYHFRTPTGFEVDIVLEDRAGRIVGIEIKSSATVTAHDFRGLKALEQLAGDKFLRGVVLYCGENAISFTHNLHAVPIETLWKTSFQTN